MGLRPPPWARVAAVMFAVGWGANQFSSLLLAYQIHRGVTETTADTLFGIYALGLIPALLLIGPLSDQRGRRPFVAAAGVLSFVASVALIIGDRSIGLLYLGRFLAGICSGAAFAAGTAWIKELSVAPFDPAAGEQAGARRAAIALSAGFGLGPLVAGLLAQWAPDPLLSAYVPQLVVVAAALMLLPHAPETVPTRRAPAVARFSAGLRFAGVGHPRFRGVVAPAAPWVFAAASLAFAVLPGLVTQSTGSFRVGFAAIVAGLTLTLGVLIQPLARRLDREDDARGSLAGLAAVTGGALVGALAASSGRWPFVVVAAALLGCGYGLCLVSGLLEIQRLAGAQDLAALTACFYALTYIGFAAPIVLAELSHLARPATLLLATGAMCVLTGAQVLRASTRYRTRTRR
jgi:MFS family permease